MRGPKKFSKAKKMWKSARQIRKAKAVNSIYNWTIARETAKVARSITKKMDQL